MTVKGTSLQTFLDEENKEKRKTDKEKVLEIIKEQAPVTRHEVYETMGKYPNQISGRFTELLDEGKIQVAGETENEAGNPVELLKPTTKGRRSIYR